METKAQGQDVIPNDATLAAVNNQEMDELLQSNFNEFRLAIGLLPDNLSDRAKEYFRKAMEEYSKRQLLKFCDHLNTYKGFEDCRFDFMLVDFKRSSCLGAVSFSAFDTVYMDSPFGRYTGIIKDVKDGKMTIESHSPRGKGMMLADYDIEGTEWQKY